MTQAIRLNVTSVNAIEQVTIRSDLERARDALRKNGQSKAWFTLVGDWAELSGSGPLLRVKPGILDPNYDRESAACLLDDLLSQDWSQTLSWEQTSGSVTHWCEQTADIFRSLANAPKDSFTIHLPYPGKPASIESKSSLSSNANALVDFLLRECPAHIGLGRIGHYIYMDGFGSKTFSPGEVIDPISVMRIIADIPKELLQ